MCMLWNLKKEILKQFPTQSDFCLKAGIREPRISQIVRGRRKPNDKEKILIAKVLNADAGQLFKSD